MNMIGHKNPGMNSHAIPLCRFLQPVCIGCHIVVCSEANLLIIPSLNDVNGQASRTVTFPTRHIVVLLVIQIKIEAEKAAIECRSLTETDVSFYTDPKYH
jgi:hypothetical protein